MMASHRQRTAGLFILLLLISICGTFKVKDEDKEAVDPDVSFLLSLFYGEQLQEVPLTCDSVDTARDCATGKDSAQPTSVLLRGFVASRDKWDQNSMQLLEALQKCGNFTDCVLQRRQDLDSLLEGLEEQKIQDLLLRASELSHSYSQKILVLADGDEGTRDQAVQEHSLDPAYSTIVSQECLSNVSCPPEPDGYTLVKVFGRVESDGQTVSGLTGWSLAQMMFHSSLRAAPVFSLDRNTSAYFQRDFMAFFSAKGTKTIVEINQETTQLYQTMAGPDSVSRYQIPQRPVDHTTQYDLQQILIMDSDPVVKKAARFLYEKHPSISSVYILDDQRKPTWLYGHGEPLSEDSRLVLVGHGGRDPSGRMRLSGLEAQDVAHIVQQIPRVGDVIKTTSVVACEVGSDEDFVGTLLKTLHQTGGIETELHLRDAVVQVQHTGEKITQYITPDGLEWRHKDDSTKVVANLNKDGEAVIRKEPGGRGVAVFTAETNLLVNDYPEERFLHYKGNWPETPRRFITQSEPFKQLSDDLSQVEALAWGFFHDELPVPAKVQTQGLQQISDRFVLAKRVEDNNKVLNLEWITDDEGCDKVLSDCYEIKSGKDVRNIIRHFAKTGEDKTVYLMVNDWIYQVLPDTLYVFPIGKKLDNNEIGQVEKITEVRKCLSDQVGQERYKDMKAFIFNGLVEHPKERYVQFVENTFSGELPGVDLPLFSKATFTTYFTASVICESARNFRTFPLILMALDMVRNNEIEIRKIGQDFFFDNHPMARGGSWPDVGNRGFSGTITPRPSRKGREERKSQSTLKEVFQLEVNQLNEWLKEVPENPLSRILEVAAKYKVTDNNSKEPVIRDYNAFENEINILKEFGETSGALAGSGDSRVTWNDIKSASELENSLKLQSYFSRASAALTEEIHEQLKQKFGERLADLQLKEGGVRIENGEFMCEFVGEPPFKFQLSEESLRHKEILMEGMATAAQDMETRTPSSSRSLEHTGTAVGAVGLLLGMKGTVDAFERGDIEGGTVGALQTAHGVTAMTASLIGREALTSETRLARAAATIMRSPAMKATMTAVPIVGIGFGIYNVKQDLERGGPLGDIDAFFDCTMIVLDVVELAQPELAVFIMPVNLALSVVRMVFDDIYMGVEEELNSLPKDASILDKLGAVVSGAGKGLLHFGIHVASIFYDWRYDEIQRGHQFVDQISDYQKYYQIVQEHGGTSAIDFSSATSSWNGGGIYFCLADEGQSEFCMDYFVSGDETLGRKCWRVDTQGVNDIILGLGESHSLEYTTLQKKVLMFIPAGSVDVVSGYKPMSDSRYGKYIGNRVANRFFAVDKSEDERVIQLMLTYYYRLWGEAGNDVFFLGPQRSYVEGAGGNDTYIIPSNGGKTIINNYDPQKAMDTLQFSVNYENISVSKSGKDVTFMYQGNHAVTIQNWFLGEAYRHMMLISGDGVVFEVSSSVVTSVQLVATAINKMFQTEGGTLDASQPLYSKVANIFGSLYDDVLIGNSQRNLMDGGGGLDYLKGGEGADLYVVKSRSTSFVVIDNESADKQTDTVIIEADFKIIQVGVGDDDIVLSAYPPDQAIVVKILHWFRSPQDRHLSFVSKDMISFTVSGYKPHCLPEDLSGRCIKVHSIDKSQATSPVDLDLETTEFESVTEVRGSNFNDNIRGNKEHNVFFPGDGEDLLEGRGGEDWYVVTPGQGVKHILNRSPDLIVDILFIKDEFKNLDSTCDGMDIRIYTSCQFNVVLSQWFESKYTQHLQIHTSDGVIAGLRPNTSGCVENLIFPISYDYRNQTPEPLGSFGPEFEPEERCYAYDTKNSKETLLCGRQGKMMVMDEVDSVTEMIGSSGFDIMVGNKNENRLDPFTGGALMSGGEGKDTYVIKREYGSDLMIDNFARDQIVDSVLIDMDFVSGSKVTLDLTPTGDLNVTVTSGGEQLKFTLLHYNDSYQHQHLQFQSSDGVLFEFKMRNSSANLPVYEVEAFKVTLRQSQSDLHFDLPAWANLSTVHTVEGGGSTSNHILGNDRDNVLMGGWKDDILEGGRGDDSLIGGNGTDILVGGAGDDILYGEEGNDTMLGDSGSDVFVPGPGWDLVDGGPGRDTVLYRGDDKEAQGVYVSLLSGQGRYADAEGDILDDMENVVGSIYSDVLVSGYQRSLLKGSDGNDLLASIGGDYLVGGDGSDIYLLAFQRGSVVIDNCAKDVALDVAFLGLRAPVAFDCQTSSEGVILTFYASDQSVVEVVLPGWISDDSRCGHLLLMFDDVQETVDRLLEECRSKEKDEAVVISRRLRELEPSQNRLLHVFDLWNTDL